MWEQLLEAETLMDQEVNSVQAEGEPSILLLLSICNCVIVVMPLLRKIDRIRVSAAERLQKGWGAGVFSQAYQMLRKDREDELRAEAVISRTEQGTHCLCVADFVHARRWSLPQAARDAATLLISFTKLSGGVVSLTADGRKVTSQTQLVLRKDCAPASL